jgi:YidC/Oxa1 family membrane protein insertase
MNQTRTFLLFAWLLVAAPKIEPQKTIASTTATTANSAATPTSGIAQSALGSNTQATFAANTPKITLTTDVLKLTLDLRGGAVVGSELLKYPIEKKVGSPNVILQTTDAANYFVAQSGVFAVNGKPGPEDNAWKFL